MLFATLDRKLDALLQRRWLVWVALLILARLPLLLTHEFANVDEAAHLLGAKTLLASGQRLYVDFVDNKPPLIYFLYAPAVWLLPGEWAMRGVHVLFLFGVVLPSVWALGSSFANRRRGTLAGVFYLLSSGSFVASDALAANTELALLLPLSFAVKFALSQRWRSSSLLPLTSGILVGLAILAKQPAALVFAAFPLYEAVSAKERRRAIAWLGRGLLLVCGAVAPLLVAALVFRSRGSETESWRWIVDVNFAHVRAPLTAADVALRCLTMLLPLVAAWLPAIASTRFVSSRERPRETFLGALLVLSLLPAFLGARLFGHYFLPALFFATWLLFERGGPARWAWGYAGFSALGFSVANVFVMHPALRAMDVTLPENERIGAALRSDECEGSLFVWGYAPQLYRTSERPPASRFVVPIDTVSGYIAGNLAYERGEVAPESRIDARDRATLLEDLRRSEPAFVLDTSGSPDLHWTQHPLTQWPELDAFVHENYRETRVVDGVRVHRHRRCDAPRER